LKQLITDSKAERKILGWSLLLCGFFVVADQITKIIVEREIAPGERIVIIPKFFDLIYVTNPGAAWGILAGKGWLLLGISIAVFIVFIVYLKRITEGWPERYFSVFLIISGIIGNSIDRIWRGEVVDFLDFYVLIQNKQYSWPAFNVADSCITVGVIIFIASSLLRPAKSDANEKETADNLEVNGADELKSSS
jgi:signal peptidase II